MELNTRRGGSLLGVLTACAALVACTRPDLRLPAVTGRSSAEHHVGKVIWLDLATPDLDAAEHFYGELFGWSFHLDPHDAGYVTVYLRDDLIGGFVKPSKADAGRRHSSWLPYLAVRDVDAAYKLSLAHGGNALMVPTTYAGRGRQAILQDPEGAVFAVMASATGDPPDRLVEPDRWIWSTVLVHDVHSDARFYQATIGYALDTLPEEQGLPQVVMESGGYARATLNEIPHDGTALHARWINFVRVEDAVATTARAVALGGRTLVSPHMDRHGGRIAVLADPEGAWFGVMEWPDGEHPKAAK